MCVCVCDGAFNFLCFQNSSSVCTELLCRMIIMHSLLTYYFLVLFPFWLYLLLFFILLVVVCYHQLLLYLFYISTKQTTRNNNTIIFTPPHTTKEYLPGRARPDEGLRLKYACRRLKKGRPTHKQVRDVYRACRYHG